MLLMRRAGIFYARPSLFCGLDGRVVATEATSFSVSEIGVAVGSMPSGRSKTRRGGSSSRSAEVRWAASWRSMQEMLPRRSWQT